MKEYIFISCNSGYGDTKSTAIKINTEDENKALIKAYAYFGGNIEVEDFKILCLHSPIQRKYKLFKVLTGEDIKYFALKKEQCFIDDLYNF